MNMPILPVMCDNAATLLGDTIIETLLTGRICTVCKIWKPASEFHRHPQTRDGLQTACKPCAKARVARWQQEHRAETRVHHNASYHRNKAKRPAYAKPYYAANKARYRANAQRWEAANLERRRAGRRAWTQANPARAKANHHAWVARKRANGGSFTAAQWGRLCDYFGKVCLACGEAKPLTADHVIPLARGGSNDISNIQPLCQPCNSRKHVRVIDYRPDAERRADDEHHQQLA